MSSTDLMKEYRKAAEVRKAAIANLKKKQKKTNQNTTHYKKKRKPPINYHVIVSLSLIIQITGPQREFLNRRTNSC